MEKSNRKIESEIDIHKEEIASVFQPDSGEIAKCKSCQILQRQMVKYCHDIKEKKDTCWNRYEFSTGYTQSRTTRIRWTAL